MNEEQAKYATIGVGAVMVIMTLVSIPLMDKAGRRTLHLYGKWQSDQLKGRTKRAGGRLPTSNCSNKYICYSFPESISGHNHRLMYKLDDYNCRPWWNVHNEHISNNILISSGKNLIEFCSLYKFALCLPTCLIRTVCTGRQTSIKSL